MCKNLKKVEQKCNTLYFKNIQTPARNSEGFFYCTDGKWAKSADCKPVVFSMGVRIPPVQQTDRFP